MTDDQKPSPKETPNAAERSKKAEEALRKFHEEEDLERVYDLRMLLRLWPQVRPHRRYLIGSMVLIVFMAGFGLVRPLIVKTVFEGLGEPDARERLMQYGLAFAGALILEYGLSFPQLYWIQLAGARSMATLRSEVFTFLHSRSLTFFDSQPIGRLVTRVTNDVDAMGDMFASGALNAVGDLVRLVAIIAVMLALDWKMSLFAFAVVPPIVVLVNWTRKRMRVVYREVRSKTARMNAFINEQVNGVGVVQAYAREKKSQDAFDDINTAYLEANVRSIGLDALLDASIEMVSSICVASVLWYAGARSLSPDVDFPTLFAFVAYIEKFFMPVRNLSQRYTQIQSGLAGAERVFQLLSAEDEDANLEASSGMESKDWPGEEQVAFELDDVTFSYKKGTPVLSAVGIEARRGETIALVGPTGSGKSTIASLLLRLYEVDAGVVRVFGKDVRQLDRTDLRRQFAVVPQDVFLFPGTVLDNIAAGDAVPDRARVQEVLDMIGASELFAGRDGGIDAEVMERGSNFSAGERQLIAFARALYRNPPVLILDEPTASIDSDTETRLQRAMDAAMQGRSALVIAHRLSTIRNADRIICLHQGAVIEQGTHDELIELDGVYAKLHRLQVARQAIEEKVGRLAEELVGNAEWSPAE